jgi:hypothetical protein
MRAGGCTGGEVAFLNLPVSLTYQSFTGTLPAIEKINVHEEGLGVLVNFMSMIRCLYRGSLTLLINDRRRIIHTPSFRLESGVLCGERLELEGEFEMTPTQTIRLI